MLLEKANFNVDFSVVVEWENVARVDVSRTRSMLNILSQQLAAELQKRDATAELLILFDSDKFDEASVRAIVTEEWVSLIGMVDLKVIPAPGLSYYQLKNEGARHARGDIVVFIDSDVIPQDNWLRNILQPFADPDTGVTQGASYVSPRSLFSKSIAIAWLFPIKRRDGSLIDKNDVNANNCAFRRSVFLECEFPDETTWRGQCTTQRLKHIAMGVGIRWCDQARTIHPFPGGLKNTLARALYNGHDYATKSLTDEEDNNLRWRGPYWRWRTHLHRARRRLRDFRQDLELGRLEALVCILIASAFWTVAFVSECLTRLCPNYYRPLLTDLPKQSSSK